MTPIAVCIPSIGKSSLLSPLVDVCVEEPGVEVIEVWDNSSTGTVHNSWPVPAETVYAPDFTIYDEFNNFAWAYNRTHHLAILNDDIAMPAGTIATLVSGFKQGNYGLVSVAPFLDADKGMVPVHGTRRQGGICSWAFVVRRNCWPDEGIDSRFKIWYGDDDLLYKMERTGWRIGMHWGASVHHLHSHTLSQTHWVAEAIGHDIDLWHNKLGRP